jgi:hypothetical protein
MLALDALRVLLRRWYVLFIGFALTAGLGFAVVSLVPTRYEARASFLLLLPAEATGADSPTNPYLNMAELTATASIVTGVVTSPDAAQSMADAGFGSTYVLAMAPSNMPLVEVSAEDTDPERAIATVTEVTRRMTAELKRIQVEANAPARQTMYSRVYNVSQEAQPLTGSKMRALVVTAAVGGLLTIMGAFLVDRLSLNRGGRRRRSPGDQVVEEGVEVREEREGDHLGVEGPPATRPEASRVRVKESDRVRAGAS